MSQFTALLIPGSVTLVAALLYGPLARCTAIITDEQVWPYLRAHQYLAEFGAGYWPQIFPDAVRGGGYAFPYYYPPFAQYVAALGAAVSGNVVVGVHLAFWLSIWLSAMAMLWAIRRLGASWPSALAAGMLYICFPYRWVLIFGRGALAESWTFFWYPVIVAGVWETWRGRPPAWWLPVAIAGVLVTHTVMASYFALLMLLFLGLGLSARGPGGPTKIAAATAMGGLLAAWYLVPSQWDLSGVLVSNRVLMWADPESVLARSLAPAQIVGLTGLGAGYGPNLNLLQLGLPVLVAVAVRRDSSQRHQLTLAVVALIIWMVLFGCLVWPTGFVRVLPERMSYIQFPWRLLGPALFFSCVCIGVSIGSLGSRAGVILSVGTAAWALLGPRPAGVNSQPQLSQAALLSLPASTGDSGYTVQAEYLPVTADPGRIARAVMASPMASAGIEVVEWTGGGHRRAVLAASRSGEVTLPLVAYPFYSFQVDGVGVTSRDQAGLWTVPVDSGDHVLMVKRRLTQPQIGGLGLAGGGVVLLAYMGFAAARRRRRDERGRATGRGPRLA